MIKKLVFSKIKIHDFYTDFIVRKLSSPLFNTIEFKLDNKNYTDFSNTKEHVNTIKHIHYITYIPTYYLEPFVNKNLAHLEFNRYVGFCIDTNGYNGLEDYVSNQFGSKSRTKLRSSIRRLETCFNVSYTMYYGSNITKEQYNKLFKVLKKMIIRRFNQRNDIHQAMKNWEYHKNSSFDFIVQKKASLFVIYDNDKPIDICLNYHFPNVFVNYIRAYDIDYSKFRLGYIDIAKQLNWCFENNHRIFDLGPGILNYKRQWCNITYNFKNLIIYNNKSLRRTTLAHTLNLFYKLKIYLDAKNIIKDNELKDIQKSNEVFQKYKSNTTPIHFTTKNIKHEDIPKNISIIDIETETHKHLRSTVYEYLYLNFEAKNNVDIYFDNKSNAYFLKGKKAAKFI